MTRKSHEIPVWKRIGAGTAAAIGLLSLNACATDKGEPAPTPTATSSEITPSPSASETSTPAPSTEFTPGATGKLSPEALSGLDSKELVERLRFTGDSPEELEESRTQAMTAFLMSGTTEEELAPYLPLTFAKQDQFVSDMDDKYSRAACEAWNGRDCDLNENMRITHSIILKSYTINAMTGSRFPDFQIGTTEIESVEVVDGNFDDNEFSIRTVENLSHNFNDSIIGKELAVGGDGSKWYRSILNSVGKKEFSSTYVRQDDHFINTSSVSIAVE